MSYFEFSELPGGMFDYEELPDIFEYDSEDDDSWDHETWESHPSLTASERNPGLR